MKRGYLLAVVAIAVVVTVVLAGCPKPPQSGSPMPPPGMMNKMGAPGGPGMGTPPAAPPADAAPADNTIPAPEAEATK